MGKHQHDEIEVVVDLEDMIVWQEDVDKAEEAVVPPPPPRGEFEGWDEGEEDLT